MLHTYHRANAGLSSASVLINQYLEPALCIAAAIMLTFGRSGLLPIFGQYTLVDELASLFVLAVTPMALLALVTRQLGHRSTLLLLGLGILILWIIVVVLTVTPFEYFPPRTALVSIGASLIIVLQVPRFRLALVRRSALVIACLFSVLVLMDYQDILREVVSGELQWRLGAEISNGNLVAYPRILWVLVITCVVSAWLEQNWRIRLLAVGAAVIPSLIALSTANRGTFVAFLLAVLLLLVATQNKLVVACVASIFVLLSSSVQQYFFRMFPILGQRLLYDADSGRFDTWTTVSKDITWFGHGIGPEYAHNLFLEAAQDYGATGFVLLVFLLVSIASRLVFAYKSTKNREIMWVLSLFTLQIVSQQFSLNIYTSMLWATIALAIVASESQPLQRT